MLYDDRTSPDELQALQLRDYQLAAANIACQLISAGANPCIVAATGSGKTLIAAELLKRYAPEGAYSITHTRELVRQNALAFKAYCPEIPYSVYSAGLGSKCLESSVIFAGIQSLVNVNGDLRNPGLTVVDEANRVPYLSESMYGKILARLGTPRVGLSATPYRLERGETALLTDKGPNGEPPWFDVLVPTVTTLELQEAGYLSPLVGVASRDEVSTQGVHTRMGEFVTHELELAATDPKCVMSVCAAIQQHAEGRKKILVFAVSVAHSEALCAELCRIGISAARIDGAMDYKQRDATLACFREGGMRALVNCMVLTMGYDEPSIDCIAMVRPTQSKALWLQALGRGLRKAEGKKDCKILDLGGNWVRHGTIDGLPDDKVEDEKAEDEKKEKEKRLHEEQERTERREATHAFKLYTGPINPEDGAEHVLNVASVDYRLSINQKNTALLQVVVTYHTEAGPIRLWLLPEHTGGARWHSQQWFSRRKLVMPRGAEEALHVATTCRAPTSIVAKKEGNFWAVIAEKFPIE